MGLIGLSGIPYIEKTGNTTTVDASKSIKHLFGTSIDVI